MSVAIDLLRVATAAGARFTVSGGRLTVTAPRPLPAELVDQLRRAKGDVIALLAADPVSSLEERAACDTLNPPGSAVADFHNSAGWMKMKVG